MKNYKILIITLLFILLLGVLIFFIWSRNTAKAEQAILFDNSISNGLEIPKTNPNDEIITHNGFTLVYNEEHEQAVWVAYLLTRERTYGKESRTNKFLEDPKISTGSATNSDYTKSGYDRGHLCPAADMAWSETTMRESFYYSNMSPQVPSFNRGIWKKLETLVRTWANEYDSIYVVTGPVLGNELDYIGNNKISIPKYYYKTILVYKSDIQQSIGFILPNQSSTLPLANFAVSIDSVEKITGIDFYHKLEDKEEQIIESQINIMNWIKLK